MSTERPQLCRWSSCCARLARRRYWWARSLSLDDTKEIVKDAFYSAGERDIYTGDTVELIVISKAGVKIETHELNID